MKVWRFSSTNYIILGKNINNQRKYNSKVQNAMGVPKSRLGRKIYRTCKLKDDSLKICGINI